MEIVLACVVAFIIALVFGTFVSKRMDKARYDTADMLACTHVKCKRRKTPDEYQNIRLREIGYEQYLKQHVKPNY